VSPRALRDERGFTLVELLVATLLSLVVLSAALAFFSQQGQALRIGTDRSSVLQNQRFALASLRRELRATGSGVPAEQPFLVYAGIDVVAFNSNYATRDPSDPFAVYVDPDAPSAEVQALTKSGRITLPNTSFTYPDTTYREAGTNSPAETIIFYFVLDGTTARTDDYVLMRQVNGATPRVVARNVLQTTGKRFFEYFEVVQSDTSASQVRVIAEGSLPLRHTRPVHGSPADTGSFARIDKLRGVRVNLTVTNGKSGDKEVRRTSTALFRLPNAGQAVLQTCGEAPMFGSGLTTDAGITVDNKPYVRLAWSRAVDESSGERDAVRYVIWRRMSTADEWGDPYISIPSGQASYTYVDEEVTPGAVHYYAIAVQDCTPALSGVSQASVFVPIP
jgi:prepilin-type N-terminal cleavage/methylation domain-containing protein